MALNADFIHTTAMSIHNINASACCLYGYNGFRINEEAIVKSKIGEIATRILSIDNDMSALELRRRNA